MSYANELPFVAKLSIRSACSLELTASLAAAHRASPGLMLAAASASLQVFTYQETLHANYALFISPRYYTPRKPILLIAIAIETLSFRFNCCIRGLCSFAVAARASKLCSLSVYFSSPFCFLPSSFILLEIYHLLGNSASIIQCRNLFRKSIFVDRFFSVLLSSLTLC